MDTPSNYDGNGEPIAEEIRARCAGRRDYVGKVQLMEEGVGSDGKLAAMLQDTEFQNFASAVS